MLWPSLSRPWQTAVSLAWDAYCAGSLPIGAVIVDDNGRIVAQGRNRIHESASAFPLSGSRLAHAEMNALIALSQTSIVPQSCTLFSTMEPCMMCLGAIRMMRIGAVWYVNQDPFAGSASLVDTAPYQALGPLPVRSFENKRLADLLMVLAVEAMLRTGRESWVAYVKTAVANPSPSIKLGRQLSASGELWQLGQEQLPIENLLAWLQRKLTR